MTTSRRAFLAGLGATAAAFALAGCGRTATEADAADAATRFDPKHPPTAPELDDDTPKYVEEARAFLVVVPAALHARAQALLPPEVQQGLEHGLLALSDVCPHDRIQLSRCRTSRWFECPACGSMFDGLGDKKGGPSPAGMTLHPVTVDDGDNVIIASRERIVGLPIGTLLVDQPAAGPHCV